VDCGFVQEFAQVVNSVQRFQVFAKRLMQTMVPTRLFLPGLPQGTPTAVRILAFPLTATDSEKVKIVRGPVTVVLDPTLALVRQVDLPKAAAAKAESAIGLQLRQTLPKQAQGLVWRSAVFARNGQTITYGVYVLKQAVIDELIVSLRRPGSRIDSIALDVADLAPFWERKPANAQAVKNWLGFSVLTTVLIGMLAVIGLGMNRSMRLDLVSMRSAQVAALQERRDGLLAEASAGEKAASATLQDMATLAAQSRRLQALADLTETLPDTVWVSELSISGDQLVFAGFTSAEVTEVISLVQALPWARDVQLNGTISVDSYSGQSRFEIGLRVLQELPS
jgi:general secretion pathway protein L